ncbi:MAG: glycerol-3-phosphate dehydrogenase/oxidase [Acuticoccus sp.]
MPQRRQTWDAIAGDGRFDAVVVGGGVNGIGVFRDLALQGVRTLLVERNDFASACSAAPSRMIHGGLRYLENGELSLVRESLRERDALLRNAPHMVRPLPTAIPIASVTSGTFNAAAGFFGFHGKPSSRGAVPIKAGLVLYDLLSRKGRTMPPHSFLGPAATRARWPALTAAARQVAIYHDAWITHPERLCIEMLADTAAAAPDSLALNYTEILREGDAFRLRDTRSGATMPVAPRLIVHATGAWLDQSAEALAAAPAERLVAGTKGSHLILDAPDLAAAHDGHMVYFENGDGRVCIVFPYLGRVLAGSTDIRVEHAGRTRCEDAERDYILASLRLVFPDIAVPADKVVFSYSGIRPLPQSNESFTGRISRGHDLRRVDGMLPQILMIGGKWTTFRAFAEQATDMALDILGAARRTGTLDRAIGGGRDFPADPAALETALAAEFALPAERTAHLIAQYGTGAAAVARACRAIGEDAPLTGTCYTRNEIVHLIREEAVETLCDIALRRTSLAITGAISLDLVAALGAILAAEKGLSPNGEAAACETLIDELATYHGVTRATLERRNHRGEFLCA